MDTSWLFLFAIDFYIERERLAIIAVAIVIRSSDNYMGSKTEATEQIQKNNQGG